MVMKQEGLDDLLSMTEHWNGYERENAVRRLGMLGKPVAIPTLIVRLNDWVPQVREAAKEALAKLMTPSNAKAFVESLPDLYHLKTCARDDHSRFIADVVKFLVADKNAEWIKEAAFSAEPKIARIAIRLCVDYSLLSREELVSKGLSHPNVLVRNISADYLREFTGEILDVLLNKAIKDPFMPIRREAFQIYLRTNPKQGFVIANAFLFDKHIAIREIAMTYLLKHDVDVKGRYSSILFENDQSVAHKKYAILGLASLGAKEEVPSILQNQNSKFPSIRRSVLQSIEKLTGECAKSLLIAALSDPSPNVAKESSRLIAKLKLKFDSNEMEKHIDLRAHSHTLALAVGAMKRSNKWERLIFLLKNLNTVPENIQPNENVILSGLAKWNTDFNRTGNQPTESQIAKIHQEFKNCSNSLNEAQKQSIAFILTGLGVHEGINKGSQSTPRGRFALAHPAPLRIAVRENQTNMGESNDLPYDSRQFYAGVLEFNRISRNAKLSVFILLIFSLTSLFPGRQNVEILFWSFLAIILCISFSLSLKKRNFPCPRCGMKVGSFGRYCNYPKVCTHCNLSLELKTYRKK